MSEHIENEIDFLVDDATGAIVGHMSCGGGPAKKVGIATIDMVSGALTDSESVRKALSDGRYFDQDFPDDDYTLGVSGVVSPQRGYLSGVELVSGSGVTLTIQDSPDAASGRTVWSLPATGAPRKFEFPKPLPFHAGLYATIGGTSPTVKFMLRGSE